jgi:integrase
MRTIRAIYNKAIKSGLVEKELYRFSNYKVKTTATEKPALDWDFIEVIIELKLTPNDICFNARNYFLASYMMYGMNFTDMASLRKSDITNGRITYRRKKTAKIYDVKISGGLSPIIDYYINQHPDSEYIFPIIKREDAVSQEKDIQWARKRYNKKLKELAKKRTEKKG